MYTYVCVRERGAFIFHFPLLLLFLFLFFFHQCIMIFDVLLCPPQMQVQSLANGHALLVAAGKDGLILWSCQPAARHADHQVALLASSAASALSGSSASGRRGSFSVSRKSTTQAEDLISDTVNINAVAFQLRNNNESKTSNVASLSSSSSSSSSDEGMTLSATFDPLAPLLHVAEFKWSMTAGVKGKGKGNPLTCVSTMVLRSLSLVPLHLIGPSLRTPLPLVAASTYKYQHSDVRPGRGSLSFFLFSS
jgi:hypothetical protein